MRAPGHGAVAAGALRWGEPVLDSAITAITPRGPAIAAALATELAAAASRSRTSRSCCGRAICRPSRVTWPRAALPLAQLAQARAAGARRST